MKQIAHIVVIVFSIALLHQAFDTASRMLPSHLRADACDPGDDDPTTDQ